jgi:DNA-binding transcriptional LysR family regulator
VVENGLGAAALPELMVQKELEIGTLHVIQIINSAGESLEIVQPVLKLKHRQRFQTQLSIAFEQLLKALPKTE